MIQERTGTVVDGLAGDRGIVGIHDAVNEPDQKPACDQFGLSRDHALEQGVIGALGLRGLRVVSCNGVVGEALDTGGIAAGRKILERADANVAGGHARQYRAGQQGISRMTLSPVMVAASDRVVGIPSAAIASLTMYSRKHRTQRCASIAAAGKRRRSRALELDVAADAVDIDDFAEQDGAAVAELRHEIAELVAGIGHGDRFGAVGQRACRRGFRRPQGSPAGPGSSPSRTASGRFNLISRGEATGVGATRAKKPSGSAA